MHALRTTVLLAALTSLAACGGARTETASTTTDDETAGGEATAETSAHPIRTTTPIPVPQPALPREEMSAGLQGLWDRVEAAVAVRPPEPPADASTESVNAWAQGPFASWLGERAQASSDVQSALEPLAEAPAHERGIAAGLYGYLQEDTVADVRGAPIPDSITADPELLQVYDHSMLEALVPYARVAVQAYRFCVAAFGETGDEAWLEWSDYCQARAEEVASTYGIDSAPGASSTAELEDPEAGAGAE